MVNLNYAVTNNLSLDELMSEALYQLQKLDYSNRMLRRYRTIWKQLILFSKQHQFDNKISEDLTRKFIDQYGVQKGQNVPSEEAWRKHVMFGIKILNNFAFYGQLERCKNDIRKLSKLNVPSAMSKALHDYGLYCKDKRHLRASSIQERIREIKVFLDFLGMRNINAFGQIKAVDLSEFVISRQRFKPKTISRIVSGVRLFLRFLTLRGIIKQDLSQHLPAIRIVQSATIPSAWNYELINKLLAAIDRSSPRGKRDYVILLLACRLGLRAGDVLRLKLDNINWEAATISITQSKTQIPLCLPLTDEVGNALIDYLSSGRPESSCREVFLKLRSPFPPLSTGQHLRHIISYWREIAGIRLPREQRQGMHSLRHSLATHLLEKETPFPIIADVLGHASMASTLIYAKTNVEALRQVALSSEEVDHVA